MKVIGLTGPTGAGKTTVLDLLKAHGAAVMDCDKIYYEMLKENEDLRQGLRDAFGEVFLPDGNLDRRKVAELVFSNEENLKKLNTLVYYHMGVEIRRRLSAAKAEGKTLAAVDAINLLQSGLGELCDTTVAVVASEETRLARIMERDGMDRERALSRIRAQEPEEYFRRHAKIVLENNGTQEALTAAAKECLAAYL